MVIVRLNGRKYHSSYFVFSGGEVQTSVPLPAGSNWEHKVELTANIRSSDDIMELLQVNDIIRRRYPTAQVSLQMPYAPYARQDRVCAPGESLACKVFADLINMCGFAKVTICDCHSDVLPALINNCVNIPMATLLDVLRPIEKTEDTILISPDSGSNKKVLEISKAFGGFDIVRADKVRDTSTGEITGTVVYADTLEGKDCIILDDICDGGRTFIELSKVLKEKGAKTVTLIVTHGIFSKGFDIFPDIDKIDALYLWN